VSASWRIANRLRGSPRRVADWTGAPLRPPAVGSPGGQPEQALTPHGSGGLSPIQPSHEVQQALNSALPVVRRLDAPPSAWLPRANRRISCRRRACARSADVAILVNQAQPQASTIRLRGAASDVTTASRPPCSRKAVGHGGYSVASPVRMDPEVGWAIFGKGGRVRDLSPEPDRGRPPTKAPGAAGTAPDTPAA